MTYDGADHIELVVRCRTEGGRAAVARFGSPKPGVVSSRAE